VATRAQNPVGHCFSHIMSQPPPKVATAQSAIYLSPFHWCLFAIASICTLFSIYDVWVMSGLHHWLKLVLFFLAQTYHLTCNQDKLMLNVYYCCLQKSWHSRRTTSFCAQIEHVTRINYFSTNTSPFGQIP